MTCSSVVDLAGVVLKARLGMIRAEGDRRDEGRKEGRGKAKREEERTEEVGREAARERENEVKRVAMMVSRRVA
jgi:hypothetical protein